MIELTMAEAESGYDFVLIEGLAEAAGNSFEGETKNGGHVEICTDGLKGYLGVETEGCDSLDVYVSRLDDFESARACPEEYSAHECVLACHALDSDVTNRLLVRVFGECHDDEDDEDNRCFKEIYINENVASVLKEALELLDIEPGQYFVLEFAAFNSDEEEADEEE